MSDVARLAAVSTAAVSYYLSGRAESLKRVGAEAQDRIRQAVEELGYVQNNTARHLRLQRTERICVLLPLLGIPFADKMTQDIEAVALRRGFLPIVMTGHGVDGFRRVLREVEAGLADGIIADADGFTPEELDELFEPFAKVNKACLVLHANAAPKSFSVLNHDRLGALMEALEHVRTKGHRHVAYVQNQSRRINPRAEALKQFIASQGDQMAPPMIVDGAQSREMAAQRARELMSLEPRPSVILVESDFTAVTIVEELQRLGLKVPEDVAVIGCGNAEEGYYCSPRLTTIGPEWLSLTEAAEHLIDMIKSRGANAPRRFLVPWRLFQRESG